MNATKRLISILAALMLMLTLCASAEVVSPTKDFYYLDTANVLSEATEGEIFFCNERLQKACGAEIVVVAIPSTGRMSIDDYAYTLFNEWEIGGESYLGYLLLMAIEDDDYYAIPGTMMAEYFSTSEIQELNDAYLEPDFAARRYDKAAKKYFEAVFDRTCDKLNLSLTVDQGIADYNAFRADTSSPERVLGGSPRKSEGGSILTPIIVILLLLLLLGIVSRSFRRRPRGGYSAPPPPPSGSGSFATGFILGRMTRRRHFPRPPRPPRPPKPPRPPFGGFGSRGDSPFSGSRPSGGFGGASRGSSHRSGGFGGASRTGGASRGPSTRGGGAGRGRR